MTVTYVQLAIFVAAASMVGLGIVVPRVRGPFFVVFLVVACLSGIIIAGKTAVANSNAANQKEADAQYQAALQEFDDQPEWRALFLEIVRVKDNPRVEMVLIQSFVDQDDLPKVSVLGLENIIWRINDRVPKKWLAERFGPHTAIPKPAPTATQYVGWSNVAKTTHSCLTCAKAWKTHSCPICG